MDLLRNTKNHHEHRITRKLLSRGTSTILPWIIAFCGNTNAVYGTTNTDAGVGIGMKIKENLRFNSKGHQLTENIID